MPLSRKVNNHYTIFFILDSRFTLKKRSRLPGQLVYHQINLRAQ